MGIIKSLEKAKMGDTASVNEIIKRYEYFIYYEMQKTINICFKEKRLVVEFL